MTKKNVFKSRILKILLYTGFIFQLSQAQNTLYMMPYESKEAIKELTSYIKKARRSIDISIFSFTNKEIAKALRDAQNTGTKIRIIYDEKSSQDNFSTIGYLEKYKNISTCTLEGLRSSNNKYNGIMHQKMVIIDSKIIALGSANWSKSAFENNYETLLFSDDVNIINHAQKYYESMFARCKKF